MKLTEFGVVEIPDGKLGYLLKPRAKDDKSKFIKNLGFTEDEPDALRQAILLLIATHDALPHSTTPYGKKYNVIGELIGPIGRRCVFSVWIEHCEAEGIYKLVTLYPAH